MTPWQKFKQDWAGKKVLIMGLGIQGRGVGNAKIFAQAGAQVTVTDLKTETELEPSLRKLRTLPLKLVLGRHEPEDFVGPDAIIRNPDVDQHHPLLDLARSRHIPVKMDSSLFVTYCPLPIIGITGTRGKTTTTLMIYQVLQDILSAPIFLGGNLPGQATLELLPFLGSTGWVILELSSWELQGWQDEAISPHISVFTNFYADHLNRYVSMDAYFQDKIAITRHQTSIDWLVVNQDDAWAQQLAQMSPARIKWFSASDLPASVKLAIPGTHNRANAAAASAVADILHLSRQKVLHSLARFPGVPYRLETIATINGITFINDTTSTTPMAGVTALEAITAPIILLAGGNTKNLDLTPFGQAIARRVKAVLLLEGSATDDLTQKISAAGGQTKITGRFADLAAAVSAAVKLAQSGDVILLSPGCTSFGMFKNEFHRGDEFNRLVKHLAL